MMKSKATIMVVDDEKYVRNLLERILGEAGYSVLTASNGREALDEASSGNVSLVLLDIRMPEMDGFQTLELIRQKSDVPVIMITGVREPSWSQTSFNLGADDYVRKPLQRHELLARIEAKLRRTKK